jgi:hypothetical protein
MNLWGSAQGATGLGEVNRLACGQFARLPDGKRASRALAVRFPKTISSPAATPMQPLNAKT